jgi:pyruvate,water dikinase
MPKVKKRFRFSRLVDCPFPERGKYKMIESIEQFEKGRRFIVVRSLSPDYFLLFSSIDAIISENGSALSHLAILAREHNIPIMIVPGITSKIHRKGNISIRGEEMVIDG